jgi:peptidyl-dipeptidase Dcp
MIGSTMLSVNAQGNPDNPLLKNGQVHTAGCLLLNTIFPKSNLLLAVIKERLSEIEAIANNPKAPTLKMIAQMERAGSDLSVS